MIANTEINETGKIFSLPFLVCPTIFLKNQLPPSPCQFFGNFVVPFEKG